MKQDLSKRSLANEQIQMNGNAPCICKKPRVLVEHTIAQVYLEVL